MRKRMQEQDYQQGIATKVIWKKLFRLLMEHKRYVVLLIIANLSLAVTDIILPIFNRYAINTYVDAHTSPDTLPMFMLVYLAIIVMQCLCVFLFCMYAARVESDFAYNLRKKCFTKLQELSFAFFDRTANGWLMARITSDTARLAEVLAWSFVDIGWGICAMVMICVVMLIVNWQMALAVLCIVPVLWFVSLYFQRRILRAQRRARKENSTVTAAFAEGINGARTTKTLGIEKANYEEFAEKTEALKYHSMHALRINACFQPIVYLLSAVVIALLLGIGGTQVVGGFIQFGTLAMFINYAQLFFDAVKQIARTLAEVQMAQANAERVLSLLEESADIVDREDVIAVYGTLLDEKREAYEQLHGDITFAHVDFHYVKGEPVLRDFNLQVKQGQSIALVGETGSGKSTIVNLLCRFYEPCGGQIYIDGKDYRERSVGWLHTHIGYVLQTPNLFSGTIRDNIRFGDPQASDERVEEVAKLLHAHDFIIKLPQGYETEVGEGGDRLSTGQKQLISFARAILSDPSIVILDEATSSIDTESEQAIQHAIGKLLENRTSFIVAHRLSTIVHADQIIVLRHGKIIEQGTHAQLMKQRGYYYELFTAQDMQEKERRLLRQDATVSYL